MESEDKLKAFKLEGVVQVSPEGDLDRELGHGAYGSVVEMRFRGLKCAGKKFYRDLYCGGNVEERELMITRCHNECLLLCSLSHPNIVQFLGTAEESGSPLPILVMEFLPFTLSYHLKKHGIYPQEISYGVLVDVAMGLCYLHGKKPTIIHRDLSANNILLTSEMRAKIADLGLAKILNATPAQSRCPGTAAYMPPEALIQNPEYRTEIDTFSYGVLIIHVLCGEWPHPDKPKRQEKDGTLVACSEYERRRKYISMLDSNSSMILLIKKCLNDNPTKRPDAEAILNYVQGVASKCPCKFDSILALLKRLESLTYELGQEQKQQQKLHHANTEKNLECDKLQSKLKHSKATYSQLKLELEEEKKKYDNKESQYKTMQSMKQEADAERDKKSKLLGFKEKMVEAQAKQIKAQAKQIKAIGSELKLQYKQTELVKEQLAYLKEQIAAMEEQLHLTEEMIDDEAQADPKQESGELELRKKHTIKETSGGIEQQQLKNKDVTNEIIKTQAKEIKEKNSELTLKEEQIKALETQIKVITEENEAASRSQVESLQAQVDCLNNQLEQIQGTEKKVREWDKWKAEEISREKELSESLNLELDILKNCQIRNLQEEVNEKERFIRELLLQQERAQSLLYSKEQTFLKFKFMRCPDLPMAMSDVQCAVIEDRVYVGGGIGENESDHAAQSRVFEYNLVEKKWRLLSQNHVRFFGLINFLGKVVSVGGMLATNAITGDVSMFDFAENCWSLDTILPMPTKRFHATVISHGECLAVCGGVVQGGNLTDVVEVLINEQWYKAPRLPYRICLAKSVVADHSCYIVGGAFSLSPLAPSNALISIPLSFLVSPSMSDQNEWKNHRKRISDSSIDDTSNYYPATGNHGGILLMLGGWSHKLSTPTSDVFAYSSEADMWVKAVNLPEPRCRFTATSQLQNGSIMLIGGVEKNNKKSSAVLLMSQKF